MRCIQFKGMRRRGHYTDHIITRLTVPYRDTLRCRRTVSVQTAEPIHRVVGQVAVGLRTVVRISVRESVHVLALDGEVFRGVPHGRIILVGHDEQRITTLVRTDRQVLLGTCLVGDALGQPNALYRTGIVLVGQNSTRRTPHRTRYPHRRIARLVIDGDRVLAGFGLDRVDAQVITLAVVHHREGGVGVGRNGDSGVIHITAYTIYARRDACK